MSIWLRSVKKEDSDYIVKWRNDESIRRHCLDDSDITEESNLIFYENNVVTKKYFQYIVEKADDDFSMVSCPIATGYLKKIDYENKKCELGFFPSNTEEWNTKNKREAIELLVDKAFNGQGLLKVYTYVFDDCFDEMALFVSAGFCQEGILKNEIITKNGDFRSLIRLAKFKNI